MAIRQAILRKKISGVLTDLMVKTYTAMVVDATSGESLDVTLEGIKALAAEHTQTLNNLIGSGTGSIGDQITAAVNALETSLKNAEDPTSFESRIAALEAWRTSMTQTLADLKTEVNTYTNNRIGDIGEQTVKAYVDAVESSLQQSIAGAFHFKGAVDYVDLLPTEGVAQGDVYQVKYLGTSEAPDTHEANVEYAWDGEKWVELGSVIDLRAYSTTAQVDEKIATAKQGAIDTAAADATAKANAAQAAAEATAAAALLEYKTTNDAAVAELGNSKGTFYASETEPENLTENDLWACLLPIAEG